MLPASLLRPLPRPTRADASAPYPLTIAWLYQQPLCDACEQALDARITAPSAPPPRLIGTGGHRRTVATQQQCCPALDDSDHGGHGCGNIRAHGQPGGQSWRKLPCVPCHGSCSEMHSTMIHGQLSSSDLLVRVIACLAEGLGIRGSARVFAPSQPRPSVVGGGCGAAHSLVSLLISAPMAHAVIEVGESVPCMERKTIL